MLPAHQQDDHAVYLPTEEEIQAEAQRFREQHMEQKRRSNNEYFGGEEYVKRETPVPHEWRWK